MKKSYALLFFFVAWWSFSAVPSAKAEQLGIAQFVCLDGASANIPVYVPSATFYSVLNNYYRLLRAGAPSFQVLNGAKNDLAYYAATQPSSFYARPGYPNTAVGLAIWYCRVYRNTTLFYGIYYSDYIR